MAVSLCGIKGGERFEGVASVMSPTTTCFVTFRGLALSCCRPLSEQVLEAHMVVASLKSESEFDAVEFVSSGSENAPPLIGGVLFFHGLISLPIRYFCIDRRVDEEW